MSSKNRKITALKTLERRVKKLEAQVRTLEDLFSGQYLYVDSSIKDKNHRNAIESLLSVVR